MLSIQNVPNDPHAWGAVDLVSVPSCVCCLHISFGNILDIHDTKGIADLLYVNLFFLSGILDVFFLSKKDLSKRHVCTSHYQRLSSLAGSIQQLHHQAGPAGYCRKQMICSAAPTHPAGLKDLKMAEGLSGYRHYELSFPQTNKSHSTC